MALKKFNLKPKVNFSKGNLRIQKKLQAYKKFKKKKIISLRTSF